MYCTSMLTLNADTSEINYNRKYHTKQLLTNIYLFYTSLRAITCETTRYISSARAKYKVTWKFCKDTSIMTTLNKD